MMLWLRHKMTAAARDEAGASGIEYGVIAALVAVVMMTALSGIGTDVSKIFTAIKTKVGTTATAVQ